MADRHDEDPFEIEAETDDHSTRVGDVIVRTRTEVTVIRPATVSRAAVEAWVKQKATPPDAEGGEWDFNEPPVGYRFHLDLDHLTRDVIGCLEAIGVTVS